MITQRTTRTAVQTTLFALFFGFLTAGLAGAKEKISLKAGNITLNANLEIADGKALSDGVVLLTHGTLANNEMEIITTLQELFKERGVNSLAINLSLGIDNRGSTMYDCKAPHKHHYLDAVNEIASWVDWLKTKGAKNITLLGHSRGGAQTASYATQKPDAAISAVVLLAPATWSQKRTAATYKKNYKTDLAPLLARAQKLVATGKAGEMMDKIGILYCADASASASAFVSYYKPDPRRDTPTLLKTVQIPTLVIAGADDKVVKGLPERVKPMADGKTIELLTVEDADHFFRDFAAEEVADAVDEFIKKQVH